MTTKLEKWVKLDTFNKEAALNRLEFRDTPDKIGKLINVEARKQGFLHAIEVLESLAFTPEFRSKDPNVLAGYVNAIKFLKQYAEEDK